MTASGIATQANGTDMAGYDRAAFDIAIGTAVSGAVFDAWLVESNESNLGNATNIQKASNVEDNYFLTGVGTGLEPLGLLNAGLTTHSIEGTTTDEVTSTTADAGSIPKIIALSYLVPAQYAESASWLMARATQGKIHALVDGENRPWWQPAANAGGTAGAPPLLLGAPVFTSPFMPVGGTNANKVAIFGDFSAYVIADRTSLSVQIDGVNHIATDETAPSTCAAAPVAASGTPTRCAWASSSSEATREKA